MRSTGVGRGVGVGVTDGRLTGVCAGRGTGVGVGVGITGALVERGRESWLLARTKPDPTTLNPAKTNATTKANRGRPSLPKLSDVRFIINNNLNLASIKLEKRLLPAHSLTFPELRR